MPAEPSPQQTKRLAYYLYKTTGDVWAIELDAHGTVVGAAGPISMKDAQPEILEHLPYDTRDIRWIRKNWPAFERNGFHPHRPVAQ
jgi:hypothetical protein